MRRVTPGISLREVTRGTTGRTVLLCLPESTSEAADPDPGSTWSRGITLLSAEPPGDPWATATPAGVAEGSQIRAEPAQSPHLASRTGTSHAAPKRTPGTAQYQSDWLRWADAVGAAIDQRAAVPGVGLPPVGAVGWSTGGLGVLALAARRPDLVDRLVLVAAPAPPDLGFDPAGVTAKTLLLYGANDPDAGPHDGKRFQRHLPNRRYEQVPGEGALFLARMWPRVLSHVAPNRRRAPSRPA